MIRYIIIIIVLFVIILITQITPTTVIKFILKHFKTNIKVCGKKNLKDYNDLKLVIMSNHHSALDQGIVTYAINSNIESDKKLYTVVKHNLLGDKNDKNGVSSFLGKFKEPIYKFFNFIPYIRGNKKSGDNIKKMMMRLVKKEKHSILLFPEGETQRIPIPKEFKPGSFKLCAENNIGVLPVSLKFNKRVGGNKGDKVKISRWYNANVIVYIHEPIFDNNWEGLRDKVFNKIREPLLNDKFCQN